MRCNMTPSAQYDSECADWTTIGPIKICVTLEPPTLNIPRSYKKKIKIKKGQKLHLKIGFRASGYNITTQWEFNDDSPPNYAQGMKYLLIYTVKRGVKLFLFSSYHG